MWWTVLTWTEWECGGRVGARGRWGSLSANQEFNCPGLANRAGSFF